VIKSFKYRLYPTNSQVQSITDQLTEARRLYNAALEHRMWAYKTAKKNINYYMQASELKQIRSDGICKLANFSSCQHVLRQADRTYQAFFNRIKRGGRAGFPRFKTATQYRTITYVSYGNGCKLIGTRVYLQGIGKIRIRLHRLVEGRIKTVSITRKNGKYYALFSCEVQPNPLPIVDKAVGIDVGLESFAVTSDGRFINNHRYYKTSQNRLRVLHRSVSRKKKGGANRKEAIRLLAKQYEAIGNQRNDFLHKITTEIIQANDIICIEDLNIKGMARGMLAKSVNDVAWGMFFIMLAYKAENAGRKLIKVNPRGTSQRCCRCGTTVHKELSDRWHHCPICGLSIHRDLNSAIEILRLGTSPCPVTWNDSSRVGHKADCSSCR
jgi:putative transposase